MKQSPNPIKKILMTSKKKVFIWTLFDFANTSFSIVVVTFLYAVYFKKVVAEGKAVGDLYWSIGTSLAMIITAIISPVLGAIADYSAGKKRFLLFFTLLCIVATASLFFVGEGNVFLGITLFVFANIGFEAGLVFYDSFLPEITEPKNFGRVSGYGFAMGYLGSLATLAIIFPFIQAEMIRESFPVAALFFLVFAIPLFIYLKDNRKIKTEKVSYLKIGISRVWNTISHLKNYKNLATFLLAYFCYIEGVNTIIFFSGNYASTTLGFTIIEIIIFFSIVQTTAIIGSVILGIIADSIGQKKTIIISLTIFFITIVLMVYFEWLKRFVEPVYNYINVLIYNNFKISFSLDLFAFIIVGLIAGAAIGSSQSTSRSLMSKLTPPDKKTEFFGFYSFFGKSSAIIGPLVFGFVSFLSGDQRLAIFSIGFFFLIGLIILLKVNDPKVEQRSN